MGTLFGQTYRSSVVQQRVNYYNVNSWYDLLPVVSWFKKLLEIINDDNSEKDDSDFEVITHSFDIEQSSVVSSVNVS